MTVDGMPELNHDDSGAQSSGIRLGRCELQEIQYHGWATPMPMPSCHRLKIEYEGGFATAGILQQPMFHQSAWDLKRYEPSHLCKNARCFRPDHLVFEGNGVNEGRKHCLAGHCQHNSPYTCTSCRVERSSPIPLVEWIPCGVNCCSTDKDGRGVYNKRTYALGIYVRELYKRHPDLCHIEPRERDLNSFIARLRAVKAHRGILNLKCSLAR